MEIARDRRTKHAVHMVILQGPFNTEAPGETLQTIVTKAIDGVELLIKVAGMKNFEVVHARLIQIGDQE